MYNIKHDYSPFGLSLLSLIVLPMSLATDRPTPYKASPALPNAFLTDCSCMCPSRPPINKSGLVRHRLDIVGCGSIIMLDKNSIAPGNKWAG